MKQEMRAIKEAIAKRNREFLGQYGGLIQAGERYKELLTLPEAELRREGVSIDARYSTYRATRFSGAGNEGQIRGVFHVRWGPHAFCPRDKGGGGDIKSSWGWNTTTFLRTLLFSYGFPLLFGFHDNDTEKSRETIATPPKSWGSYRPR